MRNRLRFSCPKYPHKLVVVVAVLCFGAPQTDQDVLELAVENPLFLDSFPWYRSAGWVSKSSYNTRLRLDVFQVFCLRVLSVDP